MKTYSLKRLNTKHDFKVNYADNKLKVLGPHTTTTFFLKNIENKISIEADLKEIDQETLEVAMEAAFNTSFEACELILNNQDSILRADFFERQNIFSINLS